MLAYIQKPYKNLHMVLFPGQEVRAKIPGLDLLYLTKKKPRV